MALRCFSYDSGTSACKNVSRPGCERTGHIKPFYSNDIDAAKPIQQLQKQQNYAFQNIIDTCRWAGVLTICCSLRAAKRQVTCEFKTKNTPAHVWKTVCWYVIRANTQQQTIISQYQLIRALPKKQKKLHVIPNIVWLRWTWTMTIEAVNCCSSMFPFHHEETHLWPIGNKKYPLYSKLHLPWSTVATP